MAVAELFARLSESYWPSLFLGGAAIAVFLWHRLSTQFNPQEPPLLKSKIPVIGHIIGMIYQGMDYYNLLYKNKPLPICTLPMLGGKLYVINSPALVQSAFRSRNLSFVPFMVEFSQRVLGLSDKVMEPFRAAPNSEKEPPMITEIVQAIHAAMQPKYLHTMNAKALEYVADALHSVPDNGMDIANLYLWLRELITIATTEALYGSENPWKKDPALVDALWNFEGDIAKILVNIAPSITASKAYRGRRMAQKALCEYYSLEQDLAPDVAQITKVRVAMLRKYGIPKDQFGNIELALAHVSTTNTIPTLFWLVLNIFSRPELVEQLRKEVLTVVKEEVRSDRKEITVNISHLEQKCPLLVSSYRETLRVGNGGVDNRRVMADTVISDGEHSYLLKEGCNVQIPVSVNHMSVEAWGPTFKEFDGKRFLTPQAKGITSEAAIEEDKMQKRSFFPFGGGKHLCPGRNFAFAENLGTLTVLVLGYEIIDQQGKTIQVPPMRPAQWGEGVCKPLDGADMRGKLRKKAGWENVEWKFVSE